MKTFFFAFFAVLISNIGFAQSDSSYYTIRLSSFDAGVTNNKINLHWKTVCFLEYAQFQIQVSEDGFIYKTVETFTADRLRCQQPFNFTDYNGGTAGKLFYRINVGSIDGRYYHSAVRLVNKGEKDFSTLRIFPTVVSSTVTLTINNSSRGLLNIYIRDYNGAIIVSKSIPAVTGLQTIHLPAGQLHSGLYFLQVIDSQKQSLISKFIKQ